MTRRMEDIDEVELRTIRAGLVVMYVLDLRKLGTLVQLNQSKPARRCHGMTHRELGKYSPRSNDELTVQYGSKDPEVLRLGKVATRQDGSYRAVCGALLCATSPTVDRAVDCPGCLRGLFRVAMTHDAHNLQIVQAIERELIRRGLTFDALPDDTRDDDDHLRKVW